MTTFTNGITPWNSDDDNTRLPTAEELESGYPCGAADQQLFNFTTAYAWGEIHNVLLSAGVTPDLADLLQLSNAIQSGKLNYVELAGTGDVATGNTSPSFSGPIPIGMVIVAKVFADNTGAVTLDINGIGAHPVVNERGDALIAKDLIAGRVVTAVFDGTSWLIIGGLSRKKRIQYITASSTFTVPAGVNQLFVRVWGGGGGGGGSGTVAQTAGGGGGGGYAEGVISVSPGQTISAVVGAGGAGGVGGAGGAGGASSFGTLTANGGSGGQPNPIGSGGAGGTASGPGLNVTGSGGGSGQDTFAGHGGSGGGGAFGGNGSSASIGTGYVAQLPGGGGAGRGGSGPGAGVAGAAGLIIVEY